MRGCPHPVLSFVVGHERYLIGLAMRIDHVKLFVTITLPVHKGDEQHTWLRTHHIFQNPEFEVALQLVTGCVLTIAQQSRITAAGSRAAGLLEFVVSRVGEAQHQMAEVFAEFVFPGQQLQHASFRSRSSVQHEVPSPMKTAPVTLPCAGVRKHTVPVRRWRVAMSRFKSILLTLTASPLKPAVRSCW